MREDPSEKGHPIENATLATQPASTSKVPNGSADMPVANDQGLESNTIAKAPIPANASATTAVLGAAPCKPAISSSEYAFILPSMVSAAVVVAGWIVVNKAQANRERRKQIREYVVGLRSELDDLESKVISYHTSSREASSEREIVTKLGRFEKACSTLPRFLSSQATFKAMRENQLCVNDSCLQRLRKAMTLKHFADEHTHPLNVHDELIQGVESATETVQQELENVRIAALD